MVMAVRRMGMTTPPLVIKVDEDDVDDVEDFLPAAKVDNLGKDPRWVRPKPPPGTPPLPFEPTLVDPLKLGAPGRPPAEFPTGKVCLCF